MNTLNISIPWASNTAAYLSCHHIFSPSDQKASVSLPVILRKLQKTSFIFLNMREKQISLNTEIFMQLINLFIFFFFFFFCCLLSLCVTEFLGFPRCPSFPIKFSLSLEFFSLQSPFLPPYSTWIANLKTTQATNLKAEALLLQPGPYHFTPVTL